ncbi:MAG: hypothetical protein RL072_578 [Actinomycetota bacterium]|jgi:uncharacterized NAD(P)/FAD-binding protein YdhS
MTRRIVIVGGGAAGTLVAIHLAHQADLQVEVSMVEPRPRLGEGVAYSTRDESHLLNVPAIGMSAHPDDADHFVRWAGCSDDSFVSRQRYADYLRDELEQRLKENRKITLRHVRQPATAISNSPASVDVGYERIYGDAIVIALGNAAPTRPDWLSTIDASRVVDDPWAHRALDRVKDGSNVLCIGTGLTFVDVALSLTRRSCRVTATSRHGLLPQVHVPIYAVAEVESHRAETAKPSERDVASPLAVLRWIRAQHDWRSALNVLRPDTQRIWRNFGEHDQRRFLRHARRHWDIHRHRMAPVVAESLQRSIADGNVVVVCGDARRLATSNDFDYVVLCTGPDDARAITQPPLDSLVARGLARRGPHGMGIDTDPETGQLVSSAGTLVPDIYAVGSLRRGTLWESTAVPEIRSEAHRLAAMLLV